MNVRPATVDEVAAIRSIARESWEHDYPDIVSRETVGETVEEWFAEEDVRDAVRDPLALLLVAVESDGTAEGWGIDEDDVLGFSHGILGTEDWTGAILRLYVRPGDRRRGIGSELLDRTVDALVAQGAETVRAMVLAENDQGNEFYRTAGFEKVESARTRIGEEYHEENVYRHDPG